MPCVVQDQTRSEWRRPQDVKRAGSLEPISETIILAKDNRQCMPAKC
jgi:hypothetical protein